MDGAKAGIGNKLIHDGGGENTEICIPSPVGRYVDNVETKWVWTICEIVNSADLGSSSKYKDEMFVFGLRWRKVPEEEQFVQG